MSRTVAEDLRAQIEQTPVVLLMKGTPMVPQCGYSAVVVAILERLGVPYQSVDVAADPAVRAAAQHWSGWPTFPQLVAHGRFIGGLELIVALDGAGALRAELEAPAAAPAP